LPRAGAIPYQLEGNALKVKITVSIDEKNLGASLEAIS